MRSKAFVAAILATAFAFSAGDAAAAKRVRYEPPRGFAGYTWGQPRTAFARLPAKPFNTGAAWIMPVVTDFYMTCGFHCDADSYQRNVADARTAGATDDEVVATLLAVAATIGIGGLVSATSDVALGLGYDIDRALERQPARPSPRGVRRRPQTAT